MSALAGPALVEGKADATVQFIPMGAKQKDVPTVHPVNGKFRALLPEGRYRVKCGGEEQTQDCLPAGVVHLDLRSGHMLDFEMSTISHKDSDVRISLKARGEGRHSFRLRCDNLTVTEAQKELNLKRGGVGTVEWNGRINSLESPWVLVVVPDGNLERRKELMGAAWE
jgi:hypothetical protein